MSNGADNASPPFLLTVEDLHVYYDQKAVLWDLHVRVPPGRLVGIVGPNGAGKSTFIRAVMGLIKPLSGRIFLMGKDPSKVRGQIAYVPQRSSIDWDFPITALEVVMMGTYPSRTGWLKWPRSKDREKAYQALEEMKMRELAHIPIQQLSGGQQQRLFLARALLQSAEVYFLDEPFVGVDLFTERMIVEQLKKLRDQGKTLFVVHHDLTSVQNYFDWVILLNTCVVASGPTNDVFTPEHLMKAYGRSGAILSELAELSPSRTS